MVSHLNKHIFGILKTGLMMCTGNFEVLEEASCSHTEYVENSDDGNCCM